MLMLSAGVVHAEWDTGTLSFRNAVSLTLCFYIATVVFMVFVGLVIGSVKNDQS